MISAVGGCFPLSPSGLVENELGPMSTRTKGRYKLKLSHGNKTTRDPALWLDTVLMKRACGMWLSFLFGFLPCKDTLFFQRGYSIIVPNVGSPEQPSPDN